jgi:hypothetical protein
LWTNVSVKHSEIMLEHSITVYWFHYDNYTIIQDGAPQWNVCCFG